jgi:hypothetical protein
VSGRLPQTNHADFGFFDSLIVSQRAWPDSIQRWDCNGLSALIGCGTTMKKGKSPGKKKAKLLGLGLDGKDGHLRVTQGENFHLVGGSEETHGLMQEKTIKLNEHLKKRGQSLDTVSREEFYELADRVGLPLLEKPTHRPN